MRRGVKIRSRRMITPKAGLCPFGPVKGKGLKPFQVAVKGGGHCSIKNNHETHEPHEKFFPLVLVLDFSIFDCEDENDDEEDFKQKNPAGLNQRGLEISSAINVSSIGNVCARPAGRISCALSCANRA